MGVAPIAVLVLGAFGVGISLARVARASRALPIDASDLASFARRRPGRLGSLPAAIRAETGESPVTALAEGLLEPEPVRRAAFCNEALHDLSWDLDWGAAMPSAALRLCVFATLLAAAAAVLLRRSDMVADLVDIVGLGGGATIVVLAARREADRLMSRGRSAVDGWVAASTRSARGATEHASS